MANAAITAPMGVQPGNFDVMAVFDDVVTNFEADDITITAVSGNGITGVTFSVTGSGTNYTIQFQLPFDVMGSFSIAITGSVLVDGETMEETVMASPPTVAYDNRSTVNATWGTVIHRPEGVRVPVLFPMDVCLVQRANVDLQVVNPTYPAVATNNDEFDISVEQDSMSAATWYIDVDIPPNEAGSFDLDIVRRVLVCPDVLDDVTITALRVDYNTIEIAIMDFDLPTAVPGEIYDQKFAFNTIVQGIHQNNAQLVIREEGGQFGSALAYRWIGTGTPTLETDIRGTDPPPATDWELLLAPPGGHLGPWYGGVELQYLLMRYPLPVPDGASGVFNRLLDVIHEDSKIRGIR